MSDRGDGVEDEVELPQCLHLAGLARHITSSAPSEGIAFCS